MSYVATLDTTNNLVSLDQVVAYLGIDDAEEDNVVTDLINGASAAIAKMCGRKLKQQSVTEYHDGTGQSVIWLRHPPVETVSLYEDDTRAFAASTLIASTDYVVDEDLGKLVYEYNAFGWGAEIIKAVYTGGYDPVPYDVQLACLLLIDWNYHNRHDKAGNKSSVGNDGGSISYLDGPREEIMRLVANYRRVL
jgi:hypothetical protein